jgi:hypothetical protein
LKRILRLADLFVQGTREPYAMTSRKQEMETKLVNSFLKGKLNSEMMKNLGSLTPDPKQVKL